MAAHFHSFDIILNSVCLISAEYYWDSGTMSHFVVRLILAELHATRCVARYDDAHGTPHLDIMTSKGNLRRKLWYGMLTNSEAFDHAIEDFKQNYENYLKEFYAR
jgi:hypothetical protein